MSKMVVSRKRHTDAPDPKNFKKIKTQYAREALTKKRMPPSKEPVSSEEDQDEIDVSDENEGTDEEKGGIQGTKTHPSRKVAVEETQNGKDGVLNGQSSREAHAKQKALAAERRAAKPNADSIARTKKIWERLRIKSAVPKDEREKLVKELFGIISGRVKEFVFKHDSVRAIQCAVKYATPEQKKQIAIELKGSYRELAESKYAKNLIAKLVVGDNKTRDIIVPDFYGHVKRLMRHPEASWIVDDIYRLAASREQKSRLLREWYGAEFAVFQAGKDEKVSADLSDILRLSPEKKGPIMHHLKEMTNQLVQKKTTGFTILHDALLQYFINVKPGSPESTEFLEMLKDDEDGDLFRNLAFTKSGSRLVCLALAYGSSKDRRTILKFFKTHIKLLSGDVHGHLVLLTAFEVIDDTVMTTKAVFPELLSKDSSEEERNDELFGQISNLTARIPLLYLLALEPPKWLCLDEDMAIMNEVKEIRKETSKKDSEVRRVELVKAMSQTLLDFLASQASSLVESSFGCQFIGEALLGCIGEKQAGLDAVAELAKVDTQNDTKLLSTAHASRMLKTLVQGGRFDKITRQIQLIEPPLKFHDLLYQQLQTVDGGILSWATGPNSFTIVAMLEAQDFSHRVELETLLRENKRQLTNLQLEDKAASAGTKIILEKIERTKKPKIKNDT